MEDFAKWLVERTGESIFTLGILIIVYRVTKYRYFGVYLLAGGLLAGNFYLNSIEIGKPNPGMSLLYGFTIPLLLSLPAILLGTPLPSKIFQQIFGRRWLVWIEMIFLWFLVLFIVEYKGYCKSSISGFIATTCAFLNYIILRDLD